MMYSVTNVEVTTYVVYLSPGRFFSEEDARVVSDRNVQRDAADAPRSSFAFFYFDMLTVNVRYGDKDVPLVSGRLAESKHYYLDAELISADTLAQLGGYDSVLQDMRSNGLDSALRCRTGNFRPYLPDKVELISVV